MSTARSAPLNNRSANNTRAPRISVIVPHYNQCDLLRRCLHSVCAQTLSRSEYEIIVCDNQTPGGISGVASEFPDIRFVAEAKRGAACARNAGVAIASGAAFAFIDADCVAHRDWLQAGLSGLEQSHLTGGEVLVTSDDAGRPSAVEAFELVFAFHQQTYINRKHFSVTANLFATRAAAMAIGPFQNGIAEDLDWCRRARTLGFRLAFNRTAIVSHPARRNWDELTAKWERLISERWGGVGEQNLIRRLEWASLAIITALSAAPHMGRVVFSSRIKRVRDKTAAAAVLVRIRFWRTRRMLALL